MFHKTVPSVPRSTESSRSGYDGLVGKTAQQRQREKVNKNLGSDGRTNTFSFIGKVITMLALIIPSLLKQGEPEPWNKKNIPLFRF